MDRHQYNQCVELYADRLFRFAFSSLRNREQAEDVVQESFARVWEKVKTVDFAKAKSYLFTTAHHAMIDEVRQRQHFASIEDLAPTKELSTQSPYPDVNDILHKALSTLPEAQRNALLLRDYEGYSYQEIGDITGMTEAQVKVNIFRARTALKNKLKSIDNLIDIAP
ncbi:MAG: sigma-70 family RNA polymerase sigma factor [Bacteroidales bacterium]|nr:sigma-70 family RNA polymerase sigma factor [Bacteroidales bacterium]